MIEEPRLLDRLRDRIRLKHYSIRTEKTYLDWNRRFILFHNKKHPRTMGAKEVEQFLTYLAVNGRVASSTQNQALSAILFMYKLVAANLKYAGPGKHRWDRLGCSLVLARTNAHRFYLRPSKEAIQLLAVIFSIHCLRPQGPQVLKILCFRVLRDRPRHRRRIRCSFRGAQIG